ncbi:MAG: hypothetical protein JO115_17740 [Pseudonocardiales bacterium]|nr:hypothetical protein [Pseudonocardiales bacterium]
MVDPRSTAWELDTPVFRVEFFRQDTAYAGVPSDLVGYESEEWELTDGDVYHALVWATEHAGPERTWTLHVTVPSSESPGLIRLAGSDPNAAHAPTTRWQFPVPDIARGQPPRAGS